VLNCDIEEISNNYYFSINSVENSKKNSELEAHLKSSKTVRDSYLVDLEIYIFVKIFEFFLVTQSI
jgi:hypothetical protein